MSQRDSEQHKKGPALRSKAASVLNHSHLCMLLRNIVKSFVTGSDRYTKVNKTNSFTSKKYEMNINSSRKPRRSNEVGLMETGNMDFQICSSLLSLGPFKVKQKCSLCLEALQGQLGITNHIKVTTVCGK